MPRLYTLPGQPFLACRYLLPNCLLSPSATGESKEVNVYLRNRLNTGLRQIAFFVIPSAVAFLALGDVIAGAIYQTGQFTRRDSVYVWAILAAMPSACWPPHWEGCMHPVYYSLKDTRTPFAMQSFASSIGCSWISMCAALPPLLGLNPRWGVVGLTASLGSVDGWSLPCCGIH